MGSLGHTGDSWLLGLGPEQGLLRGRGERWGMDEVMLGWDFSGILGAD